MTVWHIEHGALYCRAKLGIARAGCGTSARANARAAPADARWRERWGVIGILHGKGVAVGRRAIDATSAEASQERSLEPDLMHRGPSNMNATADSGSAKRNAAFRR